MKLKIIGVVAIALLAFAGAAQASGLFDRDSDQVSTMRALERAALHPGADVATASARRGPRGFKGPRGAKGAAGPKGATGAAGPAGPAGTFGTITQVTGPNVTLCGFEFQCSIGTAHAECPPGTRVIGGGFGGLFTGEDFFSFAAGNGWSVGAANWSENALTSFHATAMCAS